MPAIFEGPRPLTSEELALAGIGVGSRGRVLALVPSGMLFRGGHSRTLREWLVDTLGLTAVIEFPPRLLLRTSIGCAVLSIEPGRASKQEAIRFVAADSDRFLEEYKLGRFRLAKWQELAAATLTRSAKNLEAVADVDKLDNSEQTNTFSIRAATRHKTWTDCWKDCEPRIWVAFAGSCFPFPSRTQTTIRLHPSLKFSCPISGLTARLSLVQRKGI